MITGKKFDVPHLFFMVFLCVWGALILYPIYNSIVVSLVPQEVYLTTPFLLFPKKLTFASYAHLFRLKSIMMGFRTTTLVTIIGTSFNVLLTVLTAYALTKKMPGNKLFGYIIILTMYLNGGLIPYYMLIKNMGLRDTLAVMIVPTGINIMYMLIMKSYFMTLPQELEESARIDGANDMTILFRIMLPLCAPMLATIALYYSVDRWNEWWLGMLFVQKPNLLPLQFLIRNMLASTNMITSQVNLPASAMKTVFPTGIQMAAIILSMAPIVFVYPFLQKYFVKGLTLGSVKM